MCLCNKSCRLATFFLFCFIFPRCMRRNNNKICNFPFIFLDASSSPLFVLDVQFSPWDSSIICFPFCQFTLKWKTTAANAKSQIVYRTKEIITHIWFSTRENILFSEIIYSKPVKVEVAARESIYGWKELVND